MEAWLRVERRAGDALSQAEHEQVRALSEVAWGPPEVVAQDPLVQHRIRWDNQYAWRLLAYEATGRLVSHVAVVVRSIRVGEQSVRVGGIAAVMTQPDLRRRGAATQAMRAAEALLCGELRVEYGLLFASEMGAPLYARLGWQPVPGPVVCEQPGGQLNWTAAFPTKVVMAKRCRAGGGALVGPVDIRGLPW